MKFSLLSIWAALMLSCVLLSCFTAKARHMGFNHHATHTSLQPHPHHNNQEESFFQKTYTRRSSKMMKGQLSVASSENKLAATVFNVSVKDIPGHNHSHKSDDSEKLASNDSGAQIFSQHRNKSANKIVPAKKKDIAVMAFRPSSSGHSPGIGHDNPPDSRH